MIYELYIGIHCLCITYQIVLLILYNADTTWRLSSVTVKSCGTSCSTQKGFFALLSCEVFSWLTRIDLWIVGRSLKSNKSLGFVDVTWCWPFGNCVHLTSVHLYLFLRDDQTQVFNLEPLKIKFLWFQPIVMLAHDPKDLRHCLHVVYSLIIVSLIKVKWHILSYTTDAGFHELSTGSIQVRILVQMSLSG